MTSARRVAHAIVVVGFAVIVLACAAQLEYKPMPVDSKIASKLEELKGLPVYFCSGMSIFFVEHKNANGNQGLYFGAPVSDVRYWRMTPYSIIAVDKIGNLGRASQFSIRFNLEPGHEAAFLAVSRDSEILASPTPLKALLAGSPASSSTDGISRGHIGAISGGRAEIGMTADDLLCSMGSPSETNDYGGVEQWVYESKNTYVYVTDHRVTNVQIIGR